MTGKPVEPETDDARSSDTPEADRRRDDMAKAAEKGLRKATFDNGEFEPAAPRDADGK
jgi:hypothetical protein